jgi:16S rRNA (guanine(527)-N(7))-methyltransferase RsmG
LFFFTQSFIVLIGMDGNKQDGTNHRDEFNRALETTLPVFGITALDERQREQLADHYAMMVVWNRHTNLTRITEPAEAARLHYAESLFVAHFLGAARRILDVGSGAGFPALPIAVAHPASEVTALEANQKKSLFLYEVKDALRLANFRVARARVEEFDLNPYDVLTSRALDRAEEVMPRVLRRLSAQQKLVLCCTMEMADHLHKTASRPCAIVTHQIPESESRLVAIFSFA